MCETMFLHFVPVDGIYYFSGILGWERCVFMLLCFLKTSLWTPSEVLQILTLGGVWADIPYRILDSLLNPTYCDHKLVGP
jgi:hypothetical protein